MIISHGGVQMRDPMETLLVGLIAIVAYLMILGIEWSL
jgi:hypothetical protein